MFISKPEEKEKKEFGDSPTFFSAPNFVGPHPCKLVTTGKLFGTPSVYFTSYCPALLKKESRKLVFTIAFIFDASCIVDISDV